MRAAETAAITETQLSQLRNIISTDLEVLGRARQWLQGNEGIPYLLFTNQQQNRRQRSIMLRCGVNCSEG
ncbi:hypothetical protein SprV_0501879300 [Sparganum proliferum]